MIKAKIISDNPRNFIEEFTEADIDSVQVSIRNNDEETLIQYLRYRNGVAAKSELSELFPELDKYDPRSLLRLFVDQGLVTDEKVVNALSRQLSAHMESERAGAWKMIMNLVGYTRDSATNKAFDDMLFGIQEGLGIIDLDGTIFYYNLIIPRMLNLGQMEMSLSNILPYVGMKGRLISEVFVNQQLLGNFRPYFMRWKGASNVSIPTIVLPSPIYSDTSKVRATMGIILDMSFLFSKFPSSALKNLLQESDGLINKAQSVILELSEYEGVKDISRVLARTLAFQKEVTFKLQDGAIKKRQLILQMMQRDEKGEEELSPKAIAYLIEAHFGVKM
jgi:hypothetical protein